MKFPDFVIIGGMKCGTTVLWHNLNKHPGINMCKNWEDPKIASTEIRFWNNGAPHKTWNKGIDWYKGLFIGDCCGEKSANYIEEPMTMKRMAKHMPDVKLVLNVRNPVDRAYSEYQMHHRKLSKPFDMSLARQRGYLCRGSYYLQIMNSVMKFFPKKSLYIVIQERMKEDTNRELNKLCDFLGVEHHDMVVKETTSEVATNRTLDLNEDGKIKNYKVWSSKYEPMSSEIRNDLLQYYKKHNEKLFGFLRYKIEEWEENK
ncbi:hypothetical protein LCGC14_0530250 [marine sediment metagenome]|uniref:Sulfotransferase domain-containing protein n=1 Tax=marine sediment metagenome TaxID=412755 RepID=A0A0F9RVV4_9ZZZZ